jgi:hypothetical protein
MPISTRRQAAASSTDGSRKIREGKDFEKSCYEFEGPNRDTDGGGCFSGVVRVDKCTICATLCAITRPLCQKHSRIRRGVEVRHTGDEARGYGVFTIRRILKGVTVAEYLGRPVDAAMLDRLYGSLTARYAVRVERTSVYLDGMGEFSVGSTVNTVSDGSEPNAEYVLRSGRLFVVTAHKVDSDTEIVVRYNPPRAASSSSSSSPSSSSSSSSSSSAAVDVA